MKVKITGLEERELNPQKFGGMCSRATVELNRENEIDFEKGIDAVATTDTPVLVVDWERWRIIREVLPMKYMEAPDDDDATLLDSHDRSSIKKIMGSARQWSADEHNAYAKLFISEAEPEVRQKIREKHIKRVSVGYQTDAEQTIEIPKEKEVVIDGVKFKNDFKDDYPFVIRLWWKVKELSLVPIPADKAAVFRAELDEKIKLMEQQNTEELEQLRNQLNDHENTIKELNIKLNERRSVMDPKELTPDEIRKQERERQIAIEAIASKFEDHFKGGKDALRKAASDAINSGKTADEFRAQVFDNYENTGPLESPLGNIGAGKEVNKFLLSRAIHNMAIGRFEGTVEERMSQAVLDKSGIKPQSKTSIFIPDDYFRNISKRTLATTSADGGQKLVGTDHLGSSFVELLRNKSALGQAGVSMLTGLKENIQIPKQTGAATFEMVAEGNAATPSEMTIGQITMSPKIGSANTQYTKTLLIQSNPSIDRLVVDDLLKIAALGVDYYGIYGTASNNQPRGLLNTSGVASPDASSLNWAKVVNFETEIAAQNADVSAIKWLLSASAKGIVKSRVKAEGQMGFLMEQNGEMNGYPSVISNQLINTQNGYPIILGCFDQMWLGEWGITEITVDPYYYSTAGIVRVTIFVHFDWAVRHAQSFAAGYAT